MRNPSPILRAAACVAAAGCVSDLAPIDLGPCAEPPDRALFEYGEIGIGTCLAAPSDIAVRPDPADPGNHLIAIANSNAFGNFRGSSLLFLDASRIDLSCPENGTHEVAASALTMQEFAGRVAFDDARDLALLTARQTAGTDGRLTDPMFVIDVADPRAPRFSPAAPEAFGPYRWVTVPSDPWSVEINPWDGRAWVLSLLTHTVSAVDLVSDPLGYVDLLSERSVSSVAFTDADASGSAPDWQSLGARPALLQDESLTMTWTDGVTRLTYAESGALFQSDSVDGDIAVELAGGAIVSPLHDWARDGFTSASVGRFGDALAGLVAGTGVDDAGAGMRSIGRMSAAEHALDWTLATAPALEPTVRGDAWDTLGIADPEWFLDEDGTLHVYFSGGAGLGTGIGHATGGAFSELARAGGDGFADGQVLAAGTGWDAGGVFGPSALRHGVTSEVLLWYSGHDGVAHGGLPGNLAIGLAVSTDGRNFVALPGPVLGPGSANEWDSLGVAYPSVFYAGGRFQLWYRGWDGTEWRTGRAESLDGVTFVKDPQNPLDGDDAVSLDPAAPGRVSAWKANPGGGYLVEGTVTGLVPGLAIEGADYEHEASPLAFRIVGGQALGRGSADDRDGAAAPAAVPDSDLVFYEARRGARAILALARQADAGLERLGTVALTGFSGGLEGLADGSLAARAPSAAAYGDAVLVAFETDAGIALASTAASALSARALTAVSPEPILTGSDELGSAHAPSLIATQAGSLLLFYEARDGDATRIGLATASAPAGPWQDQGLLLDRGPAGAWDDAAVGAPAVAWDAAAGLYRLAYAGSDGDLFRIGLATSVDGRSFTRASPSVPVFTADSVAFADGDAFSPDLSSRADGWDLLFEGRIAGVPRIGRARSGDGALFTAIPNPTTHGDRFALTTRRGDADPSSAIQLGDDQTAPREVEGIAIHGAGASAMVISPDGSRALVANKRLPFLIVLDIRDDSTSDWVDANAFDIEAAVRIPQRRGVVGLRDLQFAGDGSLYALMAPMVMSESSEPELQTGVEGLIRIDLGAVPDDAEADLVLDDAVTAFYPLARGIEEDAGYTNDVSVGPVALVLAADGRRAYVANYNDNSVWIVDLAGSARGRTLRFVRGLDENPAELALSPDGRLLYVASYLGQVRGDAGNSTVQVIDVDETSPRFGEVLTRVSNLASRADHGCD